MYSDSQVFLCERNGSNGTVGVLGGVVLRPRLAAVAIQGGDSTRYTQGEFFQTIRSALLLQQHRCDKQFHDSSTHNCHECGLGLLQVEAWRARGRVPLGVDITASLLETALCDASFWGRLAAAAADAPTGATAAAASTAGRSASVSQQQLRMQYAAAIVR